MRRLLLISFAGSALALSSACSLTGWSGDDGQFSANAAKFRANPSGEARAVTGSALGFFDAKGRIVSYVSNVKYDKRDADDAGKATKMVVRSYQVALDPGDHGGFDQNYNGPSVSDPIQAGGDDHANVTYTHSTGDTNHDGWVSGNFNVPCGITSGIGFGGDSLPGSAFFQDTTVCVKPNAVGNFSSGVTEGRGGGGHMPLKENEVQEHAYDDNSAFDRLPFSARVDLMNSVNTKTDVSMDKGVEVITVRITGVRVGDQTYTPQGVALKIRGMNTTAVDANNTGGKLMVGWIADRAAEQLAAGAKTLDASVQVNGSVTLSLAQALGNKTITTTGLNQAVVDSLHRYAAGASSLSSK